MRKAIIFILGVVMTTSCAEKQMFETMTSDMPAQTPASESLDGLMAQAKWGDGNAYLKLADYFINGQNGAEKDFMATLTMLMMAQEYGAIRKADDYISTLPEDDETRIAFEAMDIIETPEKEKGIELADRLITMGCANGYALKGYASMEMGDTLEALRLTALAAERGSSLGWTLHSVIPYASMKDMPDESIMAPIAEQVPIFYLLMAQDIRYRQDDFPEYKDKVARLYLKADENSCLDRMGARFLLDYNEYDGRLPLSETDLQRLRQLANFGSEDTPTIEYDESEMESWEESADSVTYDFDSNIEEAAKAAVEEILEVIDSIEADK